MADGNGVTRREFEELKQDLRDVSQDLKDTRRGLRDEFKGLDEHGSRALGLLLLRVSTLEAKMAGQESNWKWLARGVAGVIFTLLAAVLIAAATGAFNGG